MSEDNKLKEIKVCVVVPSFTSHPFGARFGEKLSDEEMKRQADKIREAISNIQTDYYFDVVIEMIEDEDSIEE